MTRRYFIEEQFKEFLKRHKTSFGVYINYNDHRTSAFCPYEGIIEKADYCSLISDAFKWSNTTEGHREIICLNLNKTDIVNSPYYYLQQNDILYVTPNKTKAKNSDIGQSTSLWFSGTSIFVSLVNIVITFFVLK